MESPSWRSTLGKLFPSLLEKNTQKQEDHNLEELLSQLSPEARTAAAIGAVRAKATDHPEYIDLALQFYEGKRCGPDFLAELALRKGDPEKAMEIYLQDSSWYADKAARIAKEHLGLDRAIQVYENVLQKEKYPQWQEGLARLYLEKGDSEKANVLFTSAREGYEERHDIERAVTLEKERGNLNEAVSVYQRAAEKSEGSNKSCYYEKAVQLAEEIGNHEKAHSLYHAALDAYLEQRFSLLSYELNSIEKIAQKTGDNDKLIKAYLKAGKPEKAAEMAQRLGKLGQAVEIYEKMREFDKAAEVALLKGDAEKAVEILYHKKGDDKKAINIASEHGCPEKVREMCEERMNIKYMCGFYEDSDFCRVAVEAMERIGDHKTAKEYCTKTVERFAALGKFKVCAEFSEKLGDEKNALAYRNLAKFTL